MVELHLLVFQILLEPKEATYYIFHQLYSTMFETPETLVKDLS